MPGLYVDTVGRKPVTIAFLLCWLVAAACTASAPDVYLVIVGQFLNGFGVGGVQAPMELLGESWPTEHDVGLLMSVLQ